MDWIDYAAPLLIAAAVFALALFLLRLARLVYKTCPYCNIDIPIGASACGNCGRDQPTESDESPASPS